MNLIGVKQIGTAKTALIGWKIKRQKVRITMIDILEVIKSLEEFGADSIEYKFNYRKDGILYEIRMSIEEVGHE